MRQIFRCGRKVAGSFFACVPMLLARRPETPLRVLCIATFDYLARLQGSQLGRTRRIALAYACDFAALRNDFYDQGELDRNVYRDLRQGLHRLAPEARTQRYIQDLRQVERGRPTFGRDGFSQPAAVAEYRAQVLALTLKWLRTISGQSMEPRFFQAFLALAELVQVVDDLLDWKDDWACRRPSYVTAFLRDQTQPSRQSMMHIHLYSNQRRSLLVAVGTRDLEAAPFVMAGFLVWCLSMTLLKIRFPR